MPRIVTLTALALSSFLVFGGIASAQTCDYAGQSFAVGLTICECPSLTSEGTGASVSKGRITSRRLTCSKDLGWVSTDSLCVDAQYHSGELAQQSYHRLYATICSRMPVNPAEAQKAAIPEETEKFLETAPKPEVLLAVQVICRRFGSLGVPCKALIEGLMASGN